MIINTNILKKGLTVVQKCCGFNNLVPITGMIGVKFDGKCISFTSTNMSEQVTYSIDVSDGTQSFDITVDADKFCKIINKTFTPTIQLDVIDSALVIKGSGTYKIPVVTDEDGEVTFPTKQIKYDVIFDDYANVEFEISIQDIKNIYNINKSALSLHNEDLELTGYYCGETCVTSDRTVITSNNTTVFKKVKEGYKNLLIPANLVALLTNIPNEKMFGYTQDGTINLWNDNFSIVAKELDGIDNYDIEAINDYISSSFDNQCVLPKSVMLDAIDRLSLFVEAYDKNSIILSFGNEGVTLKSMQQNSVELVRYISNDKPNTFSCSIDINMLKSEINSLPEEQFTLYYGDENAIKLCNANVTQIIALNDE